MTSDESDPMDTDFETLSAYVDGELSGAETAGVEARLAVSPSARATVEELRVLKAMLAAPPRPGLSELQSAMLMRTVRRELGIERAAKAPRGERFLRYLAPAAVGAAAVAALIVVVPRVLSNGDSDLASSGNAADTTQIGTAAEVDRTAVGEAELAEDALAASTAAVDAATADTAAALEEAAAPAEAVDTTEAATEETAAVVDTTSAAAETSLAAGGESFPPLIPVAEDASTAAGLRAVLDSLPAFGVVPVADVDASGDEQRFSAGSLDPAVVCELAVLPSRAVLAFGYTPDGTTVVVAQLEDGTLEAVAYGAECTELDRVSG